MREAYLAISAPVRRIRSRSCYDGYGPLECVHDDVLCA